MFKNNSSIYKKAVLSSGKGVFIHVSGVETENGLMWDLMRTVPFGRI